MIEINNYKLLIRHSGFLSAFSDGVNIQLQHNVDILRFFTVNRHGLYLFRFKPSTFIDSGDDSKLVIVGVDEI